MWNKRRDYIFIYMTIITIEIITFVVISLFITVKIIDDMFLWSVSSSFKNLKLRNFAITYKLDGKEIYIVILFCIDRNLSPNLCTHFVNSSLQSAKNFIISENLKIIMFNLKFIFLLKWNKIKSYLYWIQVWWRPQVEFKSLSIKDLPCKLLHPSKSLT